MLEYIVRPGAARRPVRAVVFDFDGTISTLRSGWEAVMRRVMLEAISGGGPWDAALENEVDAYIDQSTGIQTAFQMQWLSERVHRDGANPDAPTDPWYYKDEYNRRLMETVRGRVEDARAHPEKREQYLVAGSVAFLKALRARGVRVYAASGTDHADVLNEMDALGVRGLFDEAAGAPEREMRCSKEKVIADLIKRRGLSGDEVCVVGDGKVEIRLGREAGMRTLGLATDEVARRGVNRVKRARLFAAGADAIAGDFLDMDALLGFLGLSDAPPRRRMELPFDGITTFTAKNRRNLVRIDTLKTPGLSPVPAWDAEGFDEFVERARRARAEGRELILSMGAHVVKCGLSRYLISLMKGGYITHLAGNGACSIHDFELAALGGTSEHVPTAIEDGSFGMWEETGGWMNAAIRRGAAEGLGYGESLGVYMDAHPEKFPHREDSLIWNAWRLDIPITFHIALGTDIIHQHPACDFAAIGKASGVDFHRMCWSVAHLDRGVYMNFGSSVIGPEVFLKALSIARNLGYPTFDITTANFDLIDLNDYRRDLGYDDPQYYYRPRKNIVNRPVSRGGRGWHFCGDHQQTIPNLWQRLTGGEARGGDETNRA